MKDAKTLLKDYLQNFQNPKYIAGLFAEDGAIELPYLASIGKNWQTIGPENIEKMATGMLLTSPDFAFINIVYYIETPNQVFAEYEVNCSAKGFPYNQHYMGRLVAESGKIKLLREAMDMVAVQEIYSKIN